MSDKLRAAINLVLSALALAAFVWLFGAELRRAWKGEVNPTAPINDRVTYAATAVAGVVAAIVAAALALPVPTPTQRNAGAQRRSILDRISDSVGSAAPVAGAWKRWLAIAYVVAYVVIGALAFLVWIKHDASSLLKAQALTFLGLILAAAKASLP